MAATAAFFVMSPLEEEKVTFWVLGVSPLAITMLVALNSFVNAARTYFLQPAQVTPVICTTYAVVFASYQPQQQSQDRERRCPSLQ